ncbi:MAG: CD3324 family protein [Lachnospiraceae bacterium]|nr:CD3324 family protein [Lachnospiraceae bacterium]
MSYINAEKVLPDWLIHQVRSYVGDGLLYIPPETRTRRAWGSKSGAKEILEARNLEIRIKKQEGISISRLALEYHLSEDTIKRILYR